MKVVKYKDSTDMNWKKYCLMVFCKGMGNGLCFQTDCNRYVGNDGDPADNLANIYEC